MVCVQVEFPLGTYHALTERGEGPEWAPSPVRLIGALLAAAEEVPSEDTAADRAVLQRLCEAPPPTLYAPPSAPAADQVKSEAGDHLERVAELRGASRWAPRNPGFSEMRREVPGAKTVNVAEVNKGGVAIGEIPVLVAWLDLELGAPERRRLTRLLADVAWLGTSRSPALCQLIDHPETTFAPPSVRWTPLRWGELSATSVGVRVPERRLIQAFDRAFEARRARRDKVESAGLMPQLRVDPWPYELASTTREGAVLDPQHWGGFSIVELDPESEMIPRASGVYLAARTFRAALMGCFAERDEAGDAPAALHGHDDRPHLAVVPLPFAGFRHGDGRVLGFALLYPHPERAPEVENAERSIDAALTHFFPNATVRRAIRVPGAGSFMVRPVAGVPLQTLAKTRYVGPSRHWTTVTPVVHSRWRKGEDETGLAVQVCADCAHVGLPAPIRIERLRSSSLRGGGNDVVPRPEKLRPEWRRSLQGPRSHLHLEFEREVLGPIVLGRARHFGLGLCLPVDPPVADA